MSNLPLPASADKLAEEAPFGSPQKVFEAVEELACMAGLNAEQIRLFASAGDMAGVEYSTRRLYAYMRALGRIVKDFKDFGHTLAPKGERP